MANKCNTSTQTPELITYLNEVSTITMMTVPSAFLSFEKKLIMNILVFSTLLTSLPTMLRLSSALVEVFCKANCLMIQPHRAKHFLTC